MLVPNDEQYLGDEYSVARNAPISFNWGPLIKPLGTHLRCSLEQNGGQERRQTVDAARHTCKIRNGRGLRPICF